MLQTHWAADHYLLLGTAPSTFTDLGITAFAINRFMPLILTKQLDFASNRDKNCHELCHQSL